MSRQVILGIGGYTADAAVCLVVDGEVVAAAAEERFTRIKHQGGWPTRSIEWALRQAGLTVRDLDHIAFSYDPWLRVSRRIPYRVLRAPRNPLLQPAIILGEAQFVAGFMARLRRLGREAGAKVHYVRHHLAHAASAFYSSPHEHAAIYTTDMRGEWDSSLWATGTGNEIRILGSTGYPNSLGIFYAGITHHLGFGEGDEYKVMGLASYGTPTRVAELERVLHAVAQGQVELDTSYLRFHRTRGFTGGSYWTRRFHDTFGPARRRDEPVEQHHMDLAASAQRVFEMAAFHQMRHLYKLAPADVLCVAGGCGLNGVMNGRVYDETPFDHVFLPSAAGDDGLALGGALHVRCAVLGHPRPAPLLRADLGPEYDDAEIERCLDLFKLDYTHHEDVVPATVELLRQGLIVGWYQGRMEFGARALGNRSIIADPTRPGMKDKINAQVKFREEFRPFAPSAAEETADRYFEIKDPIPFMTVVVKVKPEGKERLAATMHVDGTARVQTVSREHQPLYWRLISEFGRASGVPVVLNTSFNVMGEPIVESPQQAVRCFYSCGMDALVIGNYVLQKPQADAGRMTLRVGAICTAPEVPRWILAALEDVAGSEAAELVLVAYQRPRPRLLPCRNSVLFRAYEALDAGVYGRNFPAHALEPVNLLERLGGVECRLIGARPNRDALERLEEARLDVILWLAEGDFPLGLLRLARHGVWYLRHGPERGGPPLFFELDADASRTVSSLRVAAGPPLKEWTIYCSPSGTDRYSLFLSRNQILWKSSTFFRRCLEAFAAGGADSITAWARRRDASSPPAARAFPARQAVPGNRRMLGFFVDLSARLARAQLQRLTSTEQWLIAYRPRTRFSVETLSFFDGYRTLEPPPGVWYADPFLIEHEGTTYLFFEQCPVMGKGVIAYVTLSADGSTSPARLALERDYHLSYPCVFRHRGELFMIPETRANRTVELYRAERFPDGWTLDTVLLRGVEAVDATFFERDDELWLFCNQSERGGSTRDELFLYRATDLRGPWSPHPKNPVVSSIATARPAGALFELDGELIRPSQENAQEYGFAINFNRVDALTPTDYRETLLRRLTPGWLPGQRGTHTWNMTDRWEVTDGLRWV